MITIHKIHDTTPFKLKTQCGIYPEKEYQLTSENYKVTCKRCKALIK